MPVQASYRGTGSYNRAPNRASRDTKPYIVKPLGKSGTMVEIDGGYRGLVPLTVELTGEQINIVSGLEHQKPSGAEIPGEHNA